MVPTVRLVKVFYDKYMFFSFVAKILITCPSLINSVTQDSESERSSDLAVALGRLTVDDDPSAVFQMEQAAVVSRLMAIAAVSKFSVEKD